MRIIAIAPSSSHMEDVAALWRRYKGTLGFFPEVALVDYARRQGLLGAVDADDRLLGYLLFYRTRRTSMGEAHVIHLCVDQAQRGKGIARALVDGLRGCNADCRGVRVRCRRDFNANTLWPRLGFRVEGEITGKAGRPITVWWLDFGHADLLSEADRERLKSKVIVVLDACVFYDLPPDEANGSPESSSLLADWIPDEIELCVTSELRNEINRCDDPEERRRTMRSMDRFTQLNATVENLITIQAKLRPLFPQELTQSDESDERELAHSIAKGASVFLTYDPRLLRLDEQTDEMFGLSIMRPAAFISSLDEVLREAAYQPTRVLGSALEERRVKGDELNEVAEIFQQAQQHEKRSGFREGLARILSRPDTVDARIVLDRDVPAALFATSQDSRGQLTVKLLRVADHSARSQLEAYTVSLLLKEALSRKCRLLSVNDRHLGSRTREALLRFGFQETQDGWHRVVLHALAPFSTLKQMLLDSVRAVPGLEAWAHTVSSQLEAAIQSGDVQAVAEFESLLWPMKVAGSGIPAYVVPIRPLWAAELFDYVLAGGRLLAANADLILRDVNVYYSSAPATSIEYPAHLLWYVSQSTIMNGAMAIRATSLLHDVVSGTLKDVYRQFRRLGVYTWDDVLRKAGRKKKITALVFGMTEVLKEPISWQDTQNLLRTLEGRANQFMRPTKIAPETYEHIYALGIGQE